MAHFKCLACKTRLRSPASKVDPIGHLCPICGSLLERVGDLGEIVGYRVIETRGSTSHRGASRAGRVIAGRVGEIIARRELKHARVRLEIERCDADSASRQAQAVSSRAPGTGDKSRETPPRSRDRRAAASAPRPPRRRECPAPAAPPRVPRARRAAASAPRPPRRRECPAPSELSMTGLIGANGHAARKFALRRRPRFGWRAMKWARRRDTKTTAPASAASAASIASDVSLVGKPRTDMSPFERRGLNANATRCQ